MSCRHAQLLTGLALTLAACGESATERAITAVNASGTRALVAAQGDFALTNVAVAALATHEELPVSADAGTERAATGGRATGHADITIGGGTNPNQKMSFSALSTDAFPNAKGQAEVHILSTLGLTDVHAEVDCLAILGNNAWVSGPVTKFRRDGQDIPFPPGFQMLFRVEDNDEAGTSVDRASLIVSRLVAQVCRSRPPLLLVASDGGNIQVSEK